MRLDIQSLLRADHPNRERHLLPIEYPLQGGGHSLRDLSKGAEHPKNKSDLHAIAEALDNYTPGDYPFEGYDASVEHRLKVDAWKADVKSIVEDPESTFPPPPNLAHPVGRKGPYGLTIYDDCDLATIVGSAHTDSSTATVKVIDLLSAEEVYSKKNSYIPALIISSDELIGARKLLYKHNGFMYYDISVDSLHFPIISRWVKNVPLNPSDQFFKNKAVRIFIKAPAVPGIEKGPFYKYLGDYYLIHTEKYLSKDQWKKARLEIKDLFVARFLEANNVVPTDRYRAQNSFTEEQVHQLFARGYIFPLVGLQQVHADDLEEAEEFFEEIKALSSPFIDLPRSTVYADSPSVYSQESAPGDEDGQTFDEYTSASGLHLPPTPVVAYNPEDQDEESDVESVDPYHAAGEAYEYENMERSAFSDDSDDEDGLEDDTDVIGMSAVSDDEVGALINDDLEDVYKMLNSADEGAATDEVEVMTDIQYSCEMVGSVMGASFHELQSFRTFLEETTDLEPLFEASEARLNFLQILQHHSQPIAPWDDSHSANGDDEDEDEDARSDTTVRPTNRLTMIPFFKGFEPRPVVDTDGGNDGVVGA